ncbi:MAG: hypothetical protein HYV54_02725, partial [Parcubacteria group bacterium]|nr:hypothetical protein [Parcubacteria group bacterium]
MEPESKPKLATAAVAVVVIIAGVLVWWYYSNKDKTPSAQDSPTLGEQISGQTQTPTDSVPDVNPYKKAETNPFQKANPLKDVYKNPFG